MNFVRVAERSRYSTVFFSHSTILILIPRIWYSIPSLFPFVCFSNPMVQNLHNLWESEREREWKKERSKMRRTLAVRSHTKTDGQALEVVSLFVFSRGGGTRRYAALGPGATGCVAALAYFSCVGIELDGSVCVGMLPEGNEWERHAEIFCLPRSQFFESGGCWGCAARGVGTRPRISAGRLSQSGRRSLPPRSTLPPLCLCWERARKLNSYSLCLTPKRSSPLYSLSLYSKYVCPMRVHVYVLCVCGSTAFLLLHRPFLLLLADTYSFYTFKRVRLSVYWLTRVTHPNDLPVNLKRTTSELRMNRDDKHKSVRISWERARWNECAPPPPPPPPHAGLLIHSYLRTDLLRRRDDDLATRLLLLLLFLLRHSSSCTRDSRVDNSTPLLS